MKNKITLLIIASVLALIALSSIQAYLVSESYELKKKAFLDETDDKVSSIHIEPALSDIFDDWGEDLKNHLADYMNQRISREEVLVRLQEKAEGSNVAYRKEYQDRLDALELGYDVDYKTNIRSIVLFEGGVNDSLYPFKEGTKIKLFGEDIDEKEAMTINISRWFSEFDYITTENDEVVTKSYNLEVKTEQRIVIKDWKTIVVQRMSFLLIASVIIFLFVIGLLYYSIKNLITQKKTSEVKTDFINNITHELKTPLATLSIATKSLKNETIITNKEAFSSTLNIVERQSNRLQKLIDQVLTNSLSSDAIVLSKESMSDNNYFSELIQDFKLAHQHSDIEIINEVCAPEVMLRIDRFHFTTALNNILENAVKYGKENTRITVKTDCKNGNYHITIGDNGIGISEKDQEHIFDKFYRVGDGNVHDVKGLGLGLYYTSQIIGAHEGRIAIQSELGTGTTFNIKIPVN